MRTNKFNTCIFLFAISITSVFAKGDKVLEEFNKQIVENDLVFTMPVDFIPTSVDLDKCEDVNYYYAIKHKTKKIEIRYSIFSYDIVLDENDTVYASLMVAVINNISGEDKFIKFTKLNKDNGLLNYNADFGATIIVNPKSEFGKGYKYAVIIALFKKDSRNVYITYLVDDITDLSTVFDKSMFSLKFKK